MDKTIVVQIDNKVMHPVYKKYVRKRVKYKVHDETNDARTGDTVLIRNAVHSAVKSDGVSRTSSSALLCSESCPTQR
jgi:ribosomal protein S17